MFICFQGLLSIYDVVLITHNSSDPLGHPDTHLAIWKRPSHLLDIRIPILIDIMHLGHMFNQTIRPSTQRIPIAIPTTQITRKPRPLPMTLSQKPWPNHKNPLHVPIHLLLNPPRPIPRNQRPTPRTQITPKDILGPPSPLQLLGTPTKQRTPRRHGTHAHQLLPAAPGPMIRRRHRAPQRRRRTRPSHGARPLRRSQGALSRRRLQHAAVLLAQRADGSLSGELACVVEFGDVGRLAGAQGFFEEGDDGRLEVDDLGLELQLGGYVALGEARAEGLVEFCVFGVDGVGGAGEGGP